MAYLKIHRNKNIIALESYIFRGRNPDDPIELHGCSEGSVSEQFIGTHVHFGKTDYLGVIHIMQSFKHSDSSKLAPEEYPKLARKLIEDQFPGHQFCIVAHTDKDHVHSHILVNPVNYETGARIHDKFRVLYDLRTKSDEICLANGLSIIERQSKEAWKKMPEQVRDQHRRGGFSWVLDMKEKADFAKSIATSFDEYAGVLNQFGIQVRVENKNISYKYPGRKTKRGDSYGLGAKYDKKSLQEIFQKNYQTFLDAGLKKTPIESVDFSDHWKFHRGSEDSFVPEYRYKDLVIPKDLIPVIQNIDLDSYSKTIGQKFLEDSEGVKRLEGRNYIKLEDNRWFNEKSKSRGGPLEFINFCYQESWLETIKRFDTTGAVKRVQEVVESKLPSFKSFYAPKPICEQKEKESNTVENSLFETSSLVSTLSKEGRIRITKNGKVKFIPQNNPNCSITFHKQKNGWVTRREHGLKQAFLSMTRSVNKPLLIFEDPITFAAYGKLLDRISRNSSTLNIRVPLQPLDEFLKENQNELKAFPKIRIVKAKESIKWGPEGNERQIEEEQRAELEKELGAKFGSIEELLKELILGRTR